MTVLPLGSWVWSGPLWEGDSDAGSWGWEGAGHEDLKQWSVLGTCCMLKMYICYPVCGLESHGYCGWYSRGTEFQVVFNINNLTACVNTYSLGQCKIWKMYKERPEVLIGPWKPSMGSGLEAGPRLPRNKSGKLTICFCLCFVKAHRRTYRGTVNKMNEKPLPNKVPTAFLGRGSFPHRLTHNSWLVSSAHRQGWPFLQDVACT